jgi:glycosyltransferase involved in cell wall biosynthesis
MELITYLVANYNNGKYIGECLASLRAQTSPHWHCLIGDDGSTDDSLALIRPWLDEKITLLTNEQNIGYTRTLMKLIAHAQSDIVGILDPDDALQPEATALVLQSYAAHEPVGFVYTNFTVYDETLTTVIAPGYARAILPGYSSLETGYVSHLKTFRRSAYAQTAGYDPTLLYAEDRDLVYKVEEVTALYFLDRPLYQYRRLPHSQSNDVQKWRIGHRNHRRAYEAALQRRRVPWRYKVLYRLHFHERYANRRLTPLAFTALGRRLWRLAVRVAGQGKAHTVDAGSRCA